MLHVPDFSFEGNDPVLQNTADNFRRHASENPVVMYRALTNVALPTWGRDEIDPDELATLAPPEHVQLYRALGDVLSTGVDNMFEYDEETQGVIDSGSHMSALREKYNEAIANDDSATQEKLQRYMRIERLSALLGQLIESSDRPS